MRRFVIDTCALVNYFGQVFGERRRLSSGTVRVLDQVFSGSAYVFLSIPAVVFLEIFDKWFATEEFARKVQYEVFERVRGCENIEVRSLDREVMESLVTLDADMAGADLNDRIVLASAMVLECPLITTDHDLTVYATARNLIPGVMR